MTSLRRYRKAYGYRQDKLAEKLHISNTYLCSLEYGLRKPSPALAKVVADFFGVKISAVFPDGVAQKVCRKPLPPEKPYRPGPPRPGRVYPRRPFGVKCWHCRSTVGMRADDIHPVLGDETTCPICGAVFYDIVPLEEAMNV